MTSNRKRQDTDEDFSLLRGSFTPAQVRKIERMNAAPRKQRKFKASARKRKHSR